MGKLFKKNLMLPSASLPSFLAMDIRLSKLVTKCWSSLKRKSSNLGFRIILELLGAISLHRCGATPFSDLCNLCDFWLLLLLLLLLLLSFVCSVEVDIFSHQFFCQGEKSVCGYFD
jgi:hypothetical protein